MKTFGLARIGRDVEVQTQQGQTAGSGIQLPQQGRKATTKQA